jgi:hypothetical protein
MSPTEAMTTSGEKAVFPLLPTMLIVVAAADTAGVLGAVGVVDALVPLLPLQPTSTNAQTAETIEPTHSLALMIFMSLLWEIRSNAVRHCKKAAHASRLASCVYMGQDENLSRRTR